MNFLPISVLTDSYKAGHFAQYPEALQMTAYGEFRRPYKGLLDDDRLVFYGMKYLVETYLHRKWTKEDVEKAALFYKTHNAGFTEYPYPKDLFLKFIKENDGYFPVTLQTLPEGSVVYPHVPVYQITAKKEYSRLTTFLETLLTQIWYPCTVATLSRRTKQICVDAFKKSVDDESWWKLGSRLHDFGFRGATCLEQSVLGGSAHILSFDGSDTMSACYYVQFGLNKGKPVASSVPATEHSVMTSWPSEKDAIMNMIKHFGKGVYSVVMDSYDYTKALNEILPSVASYKLKQGGFFVVRPDSGDPVEAVLEGLHAIEKVFGADKNKKGYKVVKNAGVIQGDGINIHDVKKILNAVLDAGFSAENCVFGMGAGLLQKCNRDTMSFATKLNFIKYADGTERDVMKTPKTDGGKYSLPGMLKVVRDPKTFVPVVYPATLKDIKSKDNLLKVVYDCGPIKGAFDETFDQLRSRVETEWNKLPKKAQVISKELQKKVDIRLKDYKKKYK